jgi:hypothetical protein
LVSCYLPDRDPDHDPDPDRDPDHDHDRDRDPDHDPDPDHDHDHDPDPDHDHDHDPDRDRDRGHDHDHDPDPDPDRDLRHLPGPVRLMLPPRLSVALNCGGLHEPFVARKPLAILPRRGSQLAGLVDDAGVRE